MTRRFERKGDERRTGADAQSSSRAAARDGLSEEELGLQHAEALPDRAALSTLNADVTIPLDPSVAADVLAGMGAEEEADGSDAHAGDEAGEGHRPGPDD